MVKSLTWSTPKLAKWQAKNHSLTERRPPSTRHFHNKRNEICTKACWDICKILLSYRSNVQGQPSWYIVPQLRPLSFRTIRMFTGEHPVSFQSVIHDHSAVIKEPHQFPNASIVDVITYSNFGIVYIQGGVYEAMYHPLL